MLKLPLYSCRSFINVNCIYREQRSQRNFPDHVSRSPLLLFKSSFLTGNYWKDQLIFFCIQPFSTAFALTACHVTAIATLYLIFISNLACNHTCANNNNTIKPLYCATTKFKYCTFFVSPSFDSRFTAKSDSPFIIPVFFGIPSNLDLSRRNHVTSNSNAGV